MRIFPLSFLLAPLLLGLSACSSLAVHERPDAAASPAAAAGAADSLPPQDLSGELLYQILEAEIALQRQHFDVAVSRYLQLADATRDPRFAERAAQVAAFIRDDHATLQAATLWVQLEPGRSDAHQMMVVAAIRIGLLETAMEHMEVLLSSTDAPPEERFELMASLLSREHDLPEAVRLMQGFVQTRQDDPDALIAYGNLAMRAGKPDEALTAIDQALELRPEWFSAILLRVRIMQLQDRPDEALDYLADAVERHPGDARLRMTYARMLMDVQRFDEAIIHYEILAESVSPNTEILFTLALVHLQLDRLDQAEQYLFRVRDSGDHNVDLDYYLGWLEEKRGNGAVAIDHYGRVMAGSENYVEARIRMAIVMAGEGDVGGARQLLQELRMQQPALQKRLFQIESELLRQAGQPKAGMDVLTAALDAFPGDFGLLYSRALLAERVDRIDIVEQDLRYIIERDPGHADALNALGYTLADRTDRYREAYDYISRAFELKPDSYAILDSMGWVLYRLGNLEEALRYLRQAHEMQHDHEIAAHLGEVLWVSGKRDEAIEIWERALEAFPDEPMLRDVMQRFVD